MPLKACTVVVNDLNETAHTIEVTAESLYEAIAQALATLRGHDRRSIIIIRSGES